MTLRNMFGKPIEVQPENITGKFREAFENFVPGEKWNLTQDANDIAQLDGNAVSASYLVISKDPLSAGGVTTLETVGTFEMPVEIAAGLSMSQRVLGQELSMEVVSTETPLPSYADAAIASISQSTTTLTVTTSTPHNLVPGKRIGIYGVTGDSRLNYPSLVVASITSTTTFTATTGPGGAIPSLTVGPYTNQGYVYFRSALGYAQNGVSEIFENATATNASVYFRSAAGDALPSGTASGNQTITVATTVGTQAIASPYTYAFLPASEYRLSLQADRGIVYDVGIDSSGGTTNRQYRTQVIPDSTKQYKLRFRFTNNKGLTVPTAKIVSAVKSASATATITTRAAHGLTTGDYVVIYGIRDTTNFAAQTTPVQVLSTPTSTTFTVTFGATATATSYGGMVARAQGGNVPASFNQGSNGSIQSAQGANGELILVASNTYTLQIGDYVNLYGLIDSAGNDLGLDGVYRLVNFTTNTARFEPIGSTPAVSTFSLVSCGGLVIKRTDARISFVRIFDYLRQRVEVLAQPAAATAAPVNVLGGTLAVSSGAITPNSNNIYNALTSTSLGASATYTGTTTNLAASATSTTVYFTAVSVAVLHTAGLTPGTLIYEVGYENSSTTPTTWFPQFTVPVPSNSSWQIFTFPVTARYYRVRFVNGETAQTGFRLATTHIYNGALGNNLTFPDYLLFPLSTTALGVSAVFTGAALDFGDVNRLYKTLTATVYTDQASATDGFKIQLSRDGTNWRDAAKATVTANTLTTVSADMIYRYARVVYTNGTVAQGSLALDCQAGV